MGSHCRRFKANFQKKSEENAKPTDKKKAKYSSDWAINCLKFCLVKEEQIGFFWLIGDFLQCLIFKFVIAITLPKGCTNTTSLLRQSGWMFGTGLLARASVHSDAQAQTRRANLDSAIGKSAMGIRPCLNPSQTRHSDTSCSSSHLLWLNWWTSDGWGNAH